MESSRVTMQSALTGLRLSASQQGYAFGFLGVLLFSGGIPATRMAVLHLPVWFVGAGRAAIAGLLALLLLSYTRQSWPTTRQWRAIALVMIGAVLGYPLLSAYAMQTISSGQGTVISALMPLMTAMWGAWLTKHRLRWPFWLCAVSSSGLVIGYSLYLHAAAPMNRGEFALFLGCLVCGFAYAKGALLAKELGAWQVICWALVLGLPITASITLSTWSEVNLEHTPSSAWFGFAYLALFSMFLGFFAWYRGLALGGVAEISQLQQLSPFLALGWGAWWLSESISAAQMLLAMTLVALIITGRRLA